MSAKRNKPHVGHVYRSKDYRLDAPNGGEPLDVLGPYEKPMDGWMHLGEVIYWVASEGKSFHPTDQSEAEADVFSAIDRDRLPVEGLNRTGEPEPIPASYFSNVTAFEPSETQSLFEQNEDKPPLTAFGGMLTLPGEDDPRWRRIRCRKDKVRELWPFGNAQSEEAQPNTKRPRKPPSRAIKMWAVDAAVKSLWPGGVPWNVDGGVPQTYKTKIIDHDAEHHDRKFLDNANKTIQRYFSDHYGWDNK